MNKQTTLYLKKMVDNDLIKGKAKFDILRHYRRYFTDNDLAAIGIIRNVTHDNPMTAKHLYEMTDIKDKISYNRLIGLLSVDPEIKAKEITVKWPVKRVAYSLSNTYDHNKTQRTALRYLISYEALANKDFFAIANKALIKTVRKNEYFDGLVDEVESVLLRSSRPRTLAHIKEELQDTNFGKASFSAIAKACHCLPNVEKSYVYDYKDVSRLAYFTI